MQPDLKQEDENTELGESMDDRILRVENPEDRSAEQNSGDELADDGRLAEALGDGAKELRRNQDRDQGSKQLGKGVARGVVELLSYVSLEDYRLRKRLKC